MYADAFRYFLIVTRFLFDICVARLSAVPALST